MRTWPSNHPIHFSRLITNVMCIGRNGQGIGMWHLQRIAASSLSRLRENLRKIAMIDSSSPWLTCQLKPQEPRGEVIAACIVKHLEDVLAFLRP